MTLRKDVREAQNQQSRLRAQAAQGGEAGAPEAGPQPTAKRLSKLREGQPRRREVRK